MEDGVHWTPPQSIESQKRPTPVELKILYTKSHVLSYLMYENRIPVSDKGSSHQFHCMVLYNVH